MVPRDLPAAGLPAVEKVLGYLNFSSGAADLQFLANVNLLFELVAAQSGTTPAWRELGCLLKQHLGRLSQ